VTPDSDLAARIRKFAADPIALPPDPIDSRSLSPQDIHADGGPTPGTQENYAVRKIDCWHLMRVRLGRRVTVQGRIWRAYKMAKTPIYAEAA
jgi:hypothetical protein